MPDPRPLDRLRDLLAASFSATHASHATAWGDPKAMSSALRELRRSLGGGDGLEMPQRDVLVEAVREFGRRRKAANFRQLKYVCYGVTLPVESAQWRIIDRTDVFAALLHEVKGQESGPRQFRRCYQGMLSGYFGFDRHGKPDGPASGNWLTLRGFLGEKLEPLLKVSRQRQQVPQWLETLGEHRNLLHDDPCKRYANALEQGHSEELRQVCAGLGIENTSWVWEEALLAYVRSVASGRDPVFKAALGGVMDLVNDRAEWRLPPSITTRATAIAVARYADCGDRPEHPVLRDTCLQRIGNPRLERAAWDAHVQHEPARQMVESWLKRRLITDFFGLLSHDGAADQRRLNYWLRWEPMITDMWFVLGNNTLGNRTEAFMDVRKRMGGHERWLDGAEPDNNAFVMRIGPLLVIEFGVTNNACYVFDARRFPVDMQRKRLDIYVHLKLKGNLARLSHTWGWERKFDEKFRSYLGILPEQVAARDAVKIVAAGSSGGLSAAPGPMVAPPARPMPAESSASLKTRGNDLFSHMAGALIGESGTVPGATPVVHRADQSAPVATPKAAVSPPRAAARRRTTFTQLQFDNLRARCVQHGLQWEDNRPKGGALWVLMPDRKRYLGFSALLDNYGFRYKEGRGFWLEKDD